MCLEKEEPLTKVANDEGCRPIAIDNRRHQTTYFETLIHLFKGNVGPACFAMAEAIKHSGLILGSALTILLASVCVYEQHVLIKCSNVMKAEFELDKRPDYAETLELSLLSNEKWKRHSVTMKRVCNTFLILTQFGFCSVYFLFIGNNVKNVMEFYDIDIPITELMMMSLIPIILTSLITNLRYLAPFSGVANICMISGIVITFFYASQDLPNIKDRTMATKSIHDLPLFFGTAIYLFEGIGLVLPLKNAMRHPKNFSKLFGVLNVGMVFLTVMFICFGFVGYWKYGEEVEASLTLNLPAGDWLAQFVMLVISFGVILGYALQFYIPIEIMFPPIKNKFKVARKHPLICEMFFRAAMVLVTFSVALLVPNLGLLISLIGAVCSTSLALVFPVVIEYLVLTRKDEPVSTSILIRNILILLFATVGFLSGGYESTRLIIKLYQK